MLKKLKQKSDIADNESTTDHVSATTSHDKIIEPPTLGGVPMNDSIVDSQSHLQIEDDAPCAEPETRHNAEVDDKPCIEAETVREKDSVCAESTASQSAEVDGRPSIEAETVHTKDSVCAESTASQSAEVDGRPSIEAETVHTKDSVCAGSTASQSAEVDGKPCVKPETDREKFGEKKWVGNKEAVETLLDGVTLVSGDCDGFEVVDKIA